MEPFGRQPPRFVPTLTDVVPLSLPLHKPAQPQEPVMDEFLRPEATPADEHDTSVADVEQAPLTPLQPEGAEPPVSAPAEPAFEELAEAATAGAASPDREWLPEAVESVGSDAGTWDAGVSSAEVPDLVMPESAPLAHSNVDLDALQEILVARILARVQPQLEAHLREVVADVVSQHTQVMARSLHHAVEDVVQQVVMDAMEQEKIQAKLGFDAYM